MKLLLNSECVHRTHACIVCIPILGGLEACPYKIYKQFHFLTLNLRVILLVNSSFKLAYIKQ